jgi:hypothetical protein
MKEKKNAVKERKDRLKSKAKNTAINFRFKSRRIGNQLFNWESEDEDLSQQKV